jgi:hypothetical protein
MTADLRHPDAEARPEAFGSALRAGAATTDFRPSGFGRFITEEEEESHE